MRSNAEAFGKSTHALLIGVNETDPSLKLPSLLSPESDVAALAAALARVDGCAIPCDQITTLTGSDADFETVTTTLSYVVDRLPEDASLLIYFAGHGLGDDEEFYLCASNTHSEYLETTAITSVHFQQCLDNQPLRGVLLVLDCCRGAGFGAHADRFFRQDSEQEYRLLITSAGANEPSYERLDGTGTLFTAGLISILSGETTVSGDPHTIRFNGLTTSLNHYVAEQLEVRGGAHQQLRAMGIHHNDPILFVHRSLSLRSIELNTARYSRAYVRHRIKQWSAISAAGLFFVAVSMYGWLDVSEYVVNDGRYLTVYQGHPEFNLPGYPIHLWTLDYGTEALLNPPTGDDFMLAAPLGQPVLPLLDVLIRLDFHAAEAANRGEDDRARGYALAILDNPRGFAAEQQLNANLVLASIASVKDRERFLSMLGDTRSDIRRAGVLALVQSDPDYILSRKLTGLPEVNTFNGPSFFPHADVLKLLEGDCTQSIRDYLAALLTINSNEPEVDDIIDVAVRLDCALTPDELASTTQRSAFWGHDEISFFANLKGIAPEVLEALRRRVRNNEVKSWDVAEIHDAYYYFDDIDCPASAVDSWQSDNGMEWLSAAGTLVRHCEDYRLDINWIGDEEEFLIQLIQNGTVLRTESLDINEGFGYRVLFVLRELELRPLGPFEDALHHMVNNVLDSQVNERALRLLMRLGSQRPLDPNFLDANVLATRQTAFEYERRRGTSDLEARLLGRIGGQDEFYVELLGRIPLSDESLGVLTNALSGSERERQQAACVLSMQASGEQVMSLLIHPQANIRHEAAKCASFHRSFESIIAALPSRVGAYPIRDKSTLTKTAKRKQELLRRLEEMSETQRRKRLELIQSAPWGLWDRGMRYWINEQIFQSWLF